MNAFTKSILIFLFYIEITSGGNPVVITTWAFSEATQAAWNYVVQNKNAIDSLEKGCLTCEEMQCDGTVGFGGSPDENGETTLDALIFDGTTMNMGAVGALRHIKPAISVAKHVLLHTTHSLIVGSQATDFAVEMGFTKEPLETDHSRQMWKNWTKSQCQPNSWMDVLPNARSSCGPYQPLESAQNSCSMENNCINQREDISSDNHDTIGMVVIDKSGNIAAGTSTNGMKYKIPGRVGDSPLPGAGAYAMTNVGGAAATGDGDVMMRFLPSFAAVQALSEGLGPAEAASKALLPIRRFYPEFFGGIVVVDHQGNFSAACSGMKTFVFSVVSDETNGKVAVQSHVCDSEKLHV